MDSGVRRVRLLGVGVAVCCVGTAVAQPQCAPLGGSYAYQICGPGRPACPSSLVCTAVGWADASCGVPSHCICNNATATTVGCTDDCSGTDSVCLPPQPVACTGNVSVSIFSGNCSGSLDAGTLNHVTVDSVCGEFPVYTSPEGPVFRAYGFLISTGGGCWSPTVENCTAIASNLSHVLGSNNHGAYTTNAWGCATTAVAGVDACFTVGSADRYSMQTTPVCTSTTTTASTSTSRSPCACITLWAPVCANGVTYSNTCHAQCAGVDSWTEGECATTAQTTTVATTVATQTQSYPCICPALWAPVCANGVTYSHTCHARCARVDSWTEGECATTAQTTTVATTVATPTPTQAVGTACSGNVSISFGGTCSGDDHMRTRHNATMAYVCDTFPVQLSPMGPVYQAYGFVISSGGACWSNTYSNCSDIAANLATVLSSDNHGSFQPNTWGCAVSEVAGVGGCYTVGDAGRVSMQTAAQCVPESQCCDPSREPGTNGNGNCRGEGYACCGATGEWACSIGDGRTFSCGGNTTTNPGGRACSSSTTTPSTPSTSTSSTICPPGVPFVHCYAEPCSVSPCPLAPSGSSCVDNYCGGCNAEWYNPDGGRIYECGTTTPSTPSASTPSTSTPSTSTPSMSTPSVSTVSTSTPSGICPPGVPIVNCFVEPCSANPCPSAPSGSTCVDNYCGGCHAEWYTPDGERIYDCTFAPTSPTAPTTVAPTGSTAPPPTPCMCILVWSPVCANGVTYGNACQATCASVTGWADGECATTMQTTTTAAAADGGGGSSSSDDPLKDTTVITLTVIAVVLVVGIATVLIITRPQPTTTSLGTSNVGVEMGPHSSRMPPSLSNAAYETSLNDGYFDVEEGYDV